MALKNRWSLLGCRIVAAVAVALAMAACGGSGGAGGGVTPPPSGADTTPDAFGFAPVVDAAAGAMTLSAEVTVLGINAPAPVEVAGGKYRVDSGVFTSTPGLLSVGSRLMLQVQASPDAGGKASMVVNVGGVSAVFEVTTVGVVLANKQVPSAAFPTLAALALQLQPGDIVDVHPLANDQSYGPVKFRRAGTAQAPIIVRGVRGTNGKLPQIRGFNDEVGGTIKFEGSHHMVLDGFEITNGANALTNNDPQASEHALHCVLNQANEVVIRNSRVFDCLNHGVIGHDQLSGSLTLDRVELSTSGCDANKGMVCESNAIKHPIYGATDPDEFPGSVLRVLNSHLHDNIAGETIKSRAQRAEIRGNWIESGGQQDHAIGLYGYQDFNASLQNPIHHEVVGNVVVAVGGNAMARFGGDGTGSTFGRTRFVNNTVLLDAGYGALNTSLPVFRLDGQLEAFSAFNNVFQVGGGLAAAQRRLVLVRENNGLQWAAGQPRLLLSHNHIPEGSVVLRLKGAGGQAFGMDQALPANYVAESWRRAPSPGFVLDTTLTAPDLNLRPDSPLRAAGQVGTQDTNRAPYGIPGALLQPMHEPVSVAPGWIGPGAARADAAGAPVLGAFD